MWAGGGIDNHTSCHGLIYLWVYIDNKNHDVGSYKLKYLDFLLKRNSMLTSLSRTLILLVFSTFCQTLVLIFLFYDKLLS